MNIQELQHALAVEPDVTVFDTENIRKPSLILSACHGLVTSSHDGTLRLVHLTAYDFLGQQTSFEVHESDREILLTSMNYLSDATFQKGACEDLAALDERLAQRPFASYAAQFWAVHARRLTPQLECQPELVERMVTFLSDKHLLQSSIQLFYWNNNQDADLRITSFNKLPSGGSPLTAACAAGVYSVVDTMLCQKFNVAHADDQGWTALHIAASNSKSTTNSATVNYPCLVISLHSSNEQHHKLRDSCLANRNLALCIVNAIFAQLACDLPDPRVIAKSRGKPVIRYSRSTQERRCIVELTSLNKLCRALLAPESPVQFNVGSYAGYRSP